MPIQLSHLTTEKTVFSDLAAVREGILAAARDAKAQNRHDTLVIELDGGQYYLSEPFVLSTEENPELDHLDITLRSKHPRAANISSWGRVFGKDLTPVAGKPGRYTYQFPKDDTGNYPLFRELFVNGEPIDMAVSPKWRNRIALTAEERDGVAKREGLYVPVEIARQLAEGETGATEIMMYVEWEFAILHVAEVDLTSVKELRGEPHALVTLREGEMDYFCEKTLRILNIGDRITFFQNSPAFLSEPYTYAYDYHNGVLHLQMPADVAPAAFAVEYPTLENLFSLKGVKNFTFESLSFTATTSRHACLGPYLAGQANTARGVGRLRHAAILAEGTRNLTVDGCAFTGIGGNGVQSVNNSWGLTVKNSTFKRVDMCGVTVGNPSYRHAEPIHRTYATRIENNYFEHIGYGYPASPAIYIGMADGVSILHNTIYGCAYSGMSVGWGWSTVYFELGEMFNVRDAEIAYNRIENFMDCLRDGGAIYVLGGNVNPTNSTRFNRMHDNYAILAESGKGEKYGYYCDGSSSNWDVFHSVMINCARPLFSQYTVASAFTHHNHIHDIYLTTPVQMISHAPYRDTLLYDLHVVTEGEQALIEKYPVVAEIRDAAGCTLIR